MPGVTTNKVCTHDSVKVVKREGVPKVRTVRVLTGLAGDTVYGVHDANLSNVTRGVVERIFTVDYGNGFQAPIPQTDRGFKECTKMSWKYLVRHIPQVSKFTHAQFIAGYSDARLRNRYIRAGESLLTQPVTRKDSDIKTFLKAEKVDFTKKPDPAPRIISPRDPRYNYALGLYIKPLEGALYKVLNRMCGGTTVMKGLNAVQVGTAIRKAWESFSQPVAIAFDAKRFDQHTGPAALRFEQKVYKRGYTGGQRQDLARLLSWQLKSKCRAWVDDGVVKFNSTIRCSGDMNTGLGTCLIACSLVNDFCQKYGIQYRLVNNGDDCVLIVESNQTALVMDNLHHHMKKAGYWFVVEDPVTEMEKLEFCQSRPVLTARGWTMVRNFPKVLSKDSVSLLPLNSKEDWMKWANDVADCGRSLTSGVPVLYEWYSALKRSGDGTFGAHPWTSRSGASYLAKGLDDKATEVTPEARVSFWEAFGWSPYYQTLVEERLRKTMIDFNPDHVGNYHYHIKLPNKNAIHYSSNQLYN